METRAAKLFKNGASQAVRLPAEFRFQGDEVYVSRDALTGDVVLSDRPGAQAWADFFALVKTVTDSADYMVERPLNQIPSTQGLFDEGLDDPVPASAGG